MKNFLFSLSVPLLFFTFIGVDAGRNIGAGDENWYICSYCCKTKKATSAPWTNGCKGSSSGTHNFQFCGKAGNYNYTCRKCDAEVYLSASQSPAASTCCGGGGTHSWYNAK